MTAANSGFIERNMLSNDEQLICKAEKHPLAVLVPGGLCLLYGLGFLLGKHREVIDYFTAEVTVTNRRLIGKKGLVSTYTMELLLEKVSAIEVEQGAVARALDYGTLIVTTDGHQRHIFSTIRSPYRFKKLFDDAIEEKKIKNKG